MRGRLDVNCCEADIYVGYNRILLAVPDAFHALRDRGFAHRYFRLGRN
jgi:hypothetical protein